MSAKQVSRREFLYLAASATAGAALVACQPQTVVIEKEVEKEVTKVVEKVVEKEVTTIVEKQVTTVVEKEVEKVVTATPLPTPEALHEAPALHQLVTGSALPPLEERLPADSLVVQPLNMIGTYGGTLRGVGMAPMTSGYGLETIVGEYFLKYNPDLAGIIPNIAKAWDASDKADTYTFHLRKDMKWSDGAPFTADDFLFWYEDIILNEELTPTKPKSWSPGGELVKVEKVDDYTVKFGFSVPYPPALTILGTGPGNETFAPKHYLQRWHITYNKDATDQASRENFDSWWKAFANHKQGITNRQAQVDMNCPHIDPWVIEEIDSFGNKYFGRNAYYWKVDTEGNQLPYIDTANRVLTQNTELLNLKVLAGDVDIVGSYLNINDFPIYKEGEQAGGYQIRLWPSAYGNHVAYAFNPTHKDPVLREIFNDIRFKRAMSVAINREEINQVVQFGRATPRQATTLPITSFYEDWMGEYYAEYTPDKAEGFLDEMGLKWDTDHKYRLRSDGKTLSVILEYTEAGGGAPKGKVGELVKEYWEKVGVQATLKEIERSLLVERWSANEVDVGIWHIDNVAEGAMHASPGQLRPPFCGDSVGWPWWTWYTSGGSEGEEPPDVIKDLFAKVDEWQQLLPGTDRYKELGKEILTINLENLWTIGTTGMVTFPIMVKNGLENVPESAIWGWDFRYFNPYRGDQWFWKA